MSYPIVREPRWPAFVAMLAAAGVYFALPEPLSLGPSWLLLVLIVLLLIPILVSDRLGHYKVTRILTFTANGIITIAMIASLILLVSVASTYRIHRVYQALERISIRIENVLE